MIEHEIDLPTRAGAMPTFIAHPERGGPHPAVLLLMDAPGVRDELRDMARRLATVGYVVLLPNLYYRAGSDTYYGPDVLTRVALVGNDLKLDDGVGTCGKEGQSVPVGVGQPTLRIDGLTVGGTA